MEPKKAKIDDSPPGGNETILVVEDDPAVRASTVSLLKRLGYRILVAADGSEAMAALDEGEDIDLLLSDVGLPGGMNGFEVAENIQARISDIKILLTSGYAEDIVGRIGSLGESVELLSKPYRINTLAVKLREILDGS